MMRIVACALFFFMPWMVSANAAYPLDSPQQTAQLNHLFHELRCLVCQNQDIADSNASLAKDLRHEVYALVRARKSDAEIISYLTARYGDFILFNPPMKGVTFLLWFGPACFVLLGLLIFWRSMRGFRHD